MFKQEPSVRASALTKWKNGYSIKTERYRITSWGDNGSLGFELYDHRYDTQELNNLANDSSYSSVFDSLKISLNNRILESKQKPKNTLTEFSNFDDSQRRILISDIGNVRIMNLYIPNGQSVESDKYIYKLSWLKALIKHIKSEQEKYKDIIILGDFNIAPEDRDVYDPEKWGEEVLCSPKERQALSKMTDLGFVDVFRLFDQDEKSFSWWDYRAASFRRNAGVRIDLILANESLSKKCVKSVIDREPRAWERPSDHTPVIAQFDI